MRREVVPNLVELRSYVFAELVSCRVRDYALATRNYEVVQSIGIYHHAKAVERGMRQRRDSEVRVILVATKIDRVVKSERKPALAAFEKASAGKALGFSAETGEGRRELWRAIRKAVLVGD